jgi:hypothetical protein
MNHHHDGHTDQRPLETQDEPTFSPFHLTTVPMTNQGLCSNCKYWEVPCLSRQSQLQLLAACLKLPRPQCCAPYGILHSDNRLVISQACINSNYSVGIWMQGNSMISHWHVPSCCIFWMLNHIYVSIRSGLMKCKMQHDEGDKSVDRAQIALQKCRMKISL